MPNTKIVIQEVDQTSPKGAPTSSDIVYVPGLASRAFEWVDRQGKIVENPTEEQQASLTQRRIINEEYFNTPVLFTSAAQFRKAFPQPYTHKWAKAVAFADEINVQDENETELTKLGLFEGYVTTVTEIKNNIETEYFQFEDKAYTYALELLDAGLYVLFEAFDDEIPAAKDNEIQKLATETNISDIQNFLAFLSGKDENNKDTNSLIHLTDKNEYNVKYLTTGGYYSYECPTETEKSKLSAAKNLLSVAQKRGDCIALIDYKHDRDLDILTTLYENVNKDFASYEKYTSYGAMFSPWDYYNCPATATVTLMPGSFGYLLSLAKAIKTNPNWLAIAGVTRGLVPGIKPRDLTTSKKLTNVVAENLQPKYGNAEEHKNISINAITNIKPYGLCIWGNRTLYPVSKDGTKALNFLNIRNMVSDIKKLAYQTAKSLMFEQDTLALWLRFKNGLTPLLNQLKTGGGISDYKIIRTTTKYDGSPLTNGEIAATIKIYPIYAVEYFEITVVLSDDDISID